MGCSKELIKKIIILLISVIVIITTIICAIYFKDKEKTQTFLPEHDYIVTENVENTENIERIIAVLNSKTMDKENTDNNINNNVIVSNSNTNSTQNNSAAHTSNTGNNTTVDTPNYYIKVNYSANVITVYTKDSDGNYTVPYKAMICSTGTSTPTSGVYSIKLKWKWLALFGNVYGYYTTQIVGNILFHSVPYLEKGNPASLEYWEYDKLGTSASMGCIRLTVEDAMWIYNNCPSGTMVEFYSSSNPGPLGKPNTPKISGYDSPYRDWDPTDPDSSNPWRTNPPTTNEPTQTTKPENKIDTNISGNVTNNTVNDMVNNVVSNNTLSDANNIISNTTLSNNNVETNNI